jgi:hypothetical protein
MVPRTYRIPVIKLKTNLKRHKKQKVYCSYNTKHFLKAKTALND